MQCERGLSVGQKTGFSNQSHLTLSGIGWLEVDNLHFFSLPDCLFTEEQMGNYSLFDTLIAISALSDGSE